ncbi:DUF4386 domain-containing protein [Runella aurantiaca]|uniref:DUF4386 domain-containing protein n=1 Tax=Runella aurantiaca TaxID=2282308 RepID=A0A369I7J5_9BACT|nr:DUF4386 domain-containing protein [Runella aurantiaca]RDB05598.1 DUF4386 domain-containing protein [Runella aurantiaca]
MNPTQKTARILALLMLSSLIIGMSINLFLLGPATFSSDYLTEAAGHSQQVISSLLLGLLTGLFMMTMAVLMYPLFRQHNPLLAVGYVAINGIKFAIGAIDKTTVYSLLAVSNEFVKGETSDKNTLKMMGSIFSNIHDWTHLSDILFSFILFFILFYLLFKSKLVPSFFSLWGMLAAMLGSAEMLLNFYGFHHQWHFLLLFPMALVQLLLSIWLLIKGFKTPTAT